MIDFSTKLLYTLSESKATITGLGSHSTTGPLVIPLNVKETESGTEYAVVAIDNYAFDDCSGLTSVTIPDSVTSIGYYAFANCSGMTSVSIGTGVTSIGPHAFDGCSRLTSVLIPNSVTSIGYAAFTHCTGLTSVTIPNSVTSIGSGAFDGCSGLTSVLIPNSVTSIGASAFYGCSELTAFIVDSNNITYISVDGVLFNKSKTILIKFPEGKSGAYKIPTSVTTIDIAAFQSCSGLTSVIIPNSVTSIGFAAFEGCSSVFSVYFLGNYVSYVGTAFKSGTTTIYVKAASDWEVTSWGGCTVQKVVAALLTYTLDLDNNATITGLGSHSTTGPLDIPSTVDGHPVVAIGNKAFYNCSGLTSVTIPASVITIDYQAFALCSGLLSVSIPNSVIGIGYQAFANCTGLTSVTIPAGVTGIGYAAFTHCTGLTSVTIPNSVTSIGSGAFDGCSGLTSVLIPNSVTSIGASAFQNCSGLTSVLIPASVTSIGDGAFYGCSGVFSAYFLGNSVPENDNAFKPGTTTIYVKSASDWAAATWGGCTVQKVVAALLTYTLDLNNNATITGLGTHSATGTLDIPSTVDGHPVVAIGDYAFSNCSGLTGAITIPASVTSIGASAFYGCSGLTSLTIPASVTSIGASAFGSCSGLTEIAVNVNNLNYSSVDGVLFNKLKTILIQFPGGKAGAYTIPASVTTIGDYAFYGCTKLIYVTFPSSVTSIGYDALQGCSSVVSVYFLGNYVGYNTNSAFKPGTTTIYVKIGATGWGSTWGGCTVQKVVAALLTYTLDLDNNATITGLGSYSSSDLIIPPTVDGHPVVAIGNQAFVNKTQLTSVTIGNGVTTIGTEAFQGCFGLTSVTIAASVTDIGPGAFGACSRLTAFIVDGNNSNYSIADGVLFNKLKTILIQFPGGKAAAYTIPASVTTIGDRAFYDCSGLTSVTIGNSVTSIGVYAFYNCSGLTSVTIPASVTSIGYYAFKDCTGVVSAYFLGDSFSYNGTAFNGTGTNIYVKATSNWEVTSWGGCTVQKVKITTPPISTAYSATQNTLLTDGVTTVPGTFRWESASITAPGVYKVIFTPDNITLVTLGYSDFADIEVNARMTNIDTGYTASISVTGNVTILSAPINNGTLTIPSTIDGHPVTSIAPRAFQNNTELKTVSIPDSITYIGPYAFSNSTTVIRVSIGDSGTRSYKSRYAAMRETAVIDDVTVAEYAFQGNTSLTAVIIGQNVRSIGTGAFNLCSSLTGVYFLGNAITENSQFDTSTTTIIYVKKDSIGWGDTFSECPVIKVEIITSPTSTPIVIGSQLSTSELNPGTATVQGIFSWNEPTQIFGGSGNYDVKFTPTDRDLLDYSFVFSVAIVVAVAAVKHNYTVYFRK